MCSLLLYENYKTSIYHFYLIYHDKLTSEVQLNEGMIWRNYCRNMCAEVLIPVGSSRVAYLILLHLLHRSKQLRNRDRSDPEPVRLMIQPKRIIILHSRSCSTHKKSGTDVTRLLAAFYNTFCLFWGYKRLTSEYGCENT